MTGGTIEEPTKCTNPTCGKAWTMQLMHNWGEYSNKQLTKMQVRNGASYCKNKPRKSLLDPAAHDHVV